VIAWWQLVHDQPVERDFEAPREVRRSRLHRDDEVPSRPLVWAQALERPELKAYNESLRVLSAGRARKTWSNPRGLPQSDEPVDGEASQPGDAHVEPAVRAGSTGAAN